MSTYAIGDIQGCFSPLEKLIQQLQFNPDNDRLWFVGDLVNRGPDSASVLRAIKERGDSAVTVLGNHDLHLLAVAAGCVPSREKDTFHDVLAAPDRDILLEWLRHQPLLHRQGECAVIHAGLLPQWSVKEAEAYAQEVHTILRSADYPRFLTALYDDKRARRWSNAMTGMDRTVVITKILTRLRICTVDGRMDLSFKCPPEQAPSGYLPWFQVPNRLNTDATIIFGHWAALGLHMQDNVIGLDSGCVWGRQLTAVRLEDRQVFQVACEAGR
jgi:bis(5'-nucleosyl)-tetraphosphatase (symmetrical)